MKYKSNIKEIIKHLFQRKAKTIQKLILKNSKYGKSHKNFK